MGSIRFIHPDTQDSLSTDFCEPQLNLLAHAQALEIGIGSRCGGHGVCGGDRVRVPAEAPLSPPTTAEQAHISAEDLALGYRLACQCYPESAELDLWVEARIERPTERA